MLTKTRIKAIASRMSFKSPITNLCLGSNRAKEAVRIKLGTRATKVSTPRRSLPYWCEASLYKLHDRASDLITAAVIAELRP